MTLYQLLIITKQISLSQFLLEVLKTKTIGGHSLKKASRNFMAAIHI